MARFHIKNGSGEDRIVDAERAEEAPDRNKVTFFDADDNPVGSFVGFMEWYPEPSL